MKLLHLLRHAKASSDTQCRGDRDRQLDPRGREAMDIMAGYFRRTGLNPPIILCSPALRARQTLAILLPSFSNPQVTFDERLYNAGWETLFQCIGGLPDTASSAMIIGHNPGMGDLALRLLNGKGDQKTEARLCEKYPTGAMATFEIPEESWSRTAFCSCLLKNFIRPVDAEMS